MDDVEIASYIIGYKRRQLQVMRVFRQQTFLLMIANPNVKKTHLQTYKDLYLLPDEQIDKVSTASVEDIKAMWEKFDDKSI